MQNNLISLASSLFEKKWGHIIVIAAICFCSFFYNLGAHDVDLMEARNFVTAREIAQNGTWLIPTMNGEVRITKPPLPTWITALARIAGGNVDNNRTMRLPAAMAASMMVFSLFGFMGTLTKDRLLPFISAVVLATSLLVIVMGRRGTWDIYCHSFMLLAMWIFSSGWNKKGTSFGLFLIGGFFLSLSFMSKGPVSFYTLLLPFVIAYTCTFGLRRISEKWKEMLLALLIFGIFSSTWPVLVHIVHPKLSEALAKTEVSSWATRHVRPFYFYAHFALYTGIWAVPVIAGFFKSFAKKRVNKFGQYYFVLLWAVLSILLLSIIPEKKERFLLPAIIPMAIMVGYLFRSLFQSCNGGIPTKGENRLVAAHTFLVCIASLCIPSVIFYFGVAKNIVSLTTGIGWSVVYFLLAGFLIYSYKIMAIGLIFFHTVVLVCLVNISLLPIIYASPLYIKNPAWQPLRDVRNIQEINNLDYFHIGNISPIQVWQIGKVVKTLSDKNEKFPYEKLPIALFSNSDSSNILNTWQLDSLEIQTLRKFRYDPRNSKRLMSVLLVKKANTANAEQQ